MAAREQTAIGSNSLLANGQCQLAGVSGAPTRFPRSLSTAAVLSLSLLAAAGCASDGSGESFAHRMTPSFMLSDKERAERNLKDPASLNVAYGRFQERTGQSVEARKSYDLALRDDPKSIDAVLGLARLDQLADKPKEAEASYQRALRLKPGDPVILAACAQFYASQKRWPEAFEKYNAAIAAAPKEAIYKHQLAVAKTRSGDITAGLALFTVLVGAEQAHYNVAYLLKQEGKLEAAARQCKLALALNPDFQPARTLYNQIHSRQLAQNAASPKRDVLQKTAAANTAGARSAVVTTDGGPNPNIGLVGDVSTSRPVTNAAGSNQVASNQTTSGLRQTSWQSPSAGAAGSQTGFSADATFDPPAAPGGAASNVAAPTAPAGGQNNGAPKDLWSKISGDGYPVY